MDERRAEKPARLATLLLFGLGTIAAAAAHPPAVEEGLASFYGRAFAGRETASGAPFDPDELTAAYPKYPGGTVLEVTNLENSRSVRVHVNDRGPAEWVQREGVIIDLSRAAAKRLGFTEDGLAPVRVEVVKMGKPWPPG